MNRERRRREKGSTSPSHPVLLQSCQSKCQDSLAVRNTPSQHRVFKDHISPWDPEASYKYYPQTSWWQQYKMWMLNRGREKKRMTGLEWMDEIIILNPRWKHKTHKISFHFSPTLNPLMAHCKQAHPSICALLVPSINPTTLSPI